MFIIFVVDTLDEDDGEETGDNEAGVSPKVQLSITYLLSQSLIIIY